MNDETHAELRRRLAPGPAPSPPPDLLNRLKKDIPEHFTASTAAPVPSRSPWQSGWAVAASLLLLMNLAYFGPRFLMRDYRYSTVGQTGKGTMSADSSLPEGLGGSRASFPTDPPPAEAPSPVMMAPPPPPPSSAASSVAPNRDTGAVDGLTGRQPTAEDVSASAANEREGSFAEVADQQDSSILKRENKDQAEQTQRDQDTAKLSKADRVDDVRPRLSARQESPAASPSESAVGDLMTLPAAAPPVAQSVRPPVAPEAPPAIPDDTQPPSRFRKNVSVATRRGGFVAVGTSPTSRFSLSNEGASFRNLEVALRHNRLPAAASIQVQELINHFDYGDASPGRGSDFAIVVEGGSAPYAMATRMMRIGVTTRELNERDTTLARSSRLVARDAVIEVRFNPQAVAEYRLVGFDEAGSGTGDAPGERVSAGETVSALYELRLKQPSRQRTPATSLGTILLSYKTQEHQPRSVERSIPAASLAPSWSEASPTLKLATLIALLGESLKNSGWQRQLRADDLASQLAALQTSFPGDRAIEELADMARQIARLRH